MNGKGGSSLREYMEEGRISVLEAKFSQLVKAVDEINKKVETLKREGSTVGEDMFCSRLEKILEQGATVWLKRRRYRLRMDEGGIYAVDEGYMFLADVRGSIVDFNELRNARVLWEIHLNGQSKFFSSVLEVQEYLMSYTVA